MAFTAAVGLLAVVACGGPKPQAMPQSVAAAAATSSMPRMSSASGTPMPAVATDSVAIKNFAFGPQTITVRVGTTVTWTNADQDAHTVTSQNAGGPLRSATLNTGGSYQYTFTKAGRYDYLCTIHPFMTATVLVTE